MGLTGKSAQQKAAQAQQEAAGKQLDLQQQIAQPQIDYMQEVLPYFKDFMGTAIPAYEQYVGTELPAFQEIMGTLTPQIQERMTATGFPTDVAQQISRYETEAGRGLGQFHAGKGTLQSGGLDQQMRQLQENIFGQKQAALLGERGLGTSQALSLLGKAPVFQPSAAPLRSIPSYDPGELYRGAVGTQAGIQQQALESGEQIGQIFAMMMAGGF